MNFSLRLKVWTLYSSKEYIDLDWIKQNVLIPTFFVCVRQRRKNASYSIYTRLCCVCNTILYGWCTFETNKKKLKWYFLWPVKALGVQVKEINFKFSDMNLKIINFFGASAACVHVRSAGEHSFSETLSVTTILPVRVMLYIGLRYFIRTSSFCVYYGYWDAYVLTLYSQIVNQNLRWAGDWARSKARQADRCTLHVRYPMGLN